MTYRLGVIGAGNMGTAIVRGALRASVLQPAEIIIADPSPEARSPLTLLGCATTADLTSMVDAQQIMLAVKPQVFPAVANTIGVLPRSMVVISIMAGLSSASIRNLLGDHARVVRVMPNTPCQVGCGVSGISLGGGAQTGDDQLAVRLFSALGEVVRVDEAHMYAVTAVSGSGPAYVFLLAEAMQQAAQAVGLSPDHAQRLVNHTIRGAGELLTTGDTSAAKLREAVTSPGGTTAAALSVMLEAGLDRLVIDAIKAARDRGIELDQ